MEPNDPLDTILASLEQACLPVAIMEGDDLHVVWLNAVGRDAAGSTPEGPVTEWRDFLDQKVRDRYEEVWRTGEPYVGIETWADASSGGPDPERRYVSLTVSPVRWEDGSMRAVVGFGQAVTSLIRSRSAARRESGEMEQRYREASDLVAQLQDAMLPTGLPVTPGTELAARYVVAQDYTVAGGDWFDAFVLDDGRIVVAVGDVVGHGVEASVTMSALKTLFEERVREDGDLVAALEMLDRRARRVPEARATTMCAVLLDPRTGDLDYCTAGHPPPVVVGADGGAAYLPTTGAGPLAGGAGFPTGRHVLAVGETLFLYSDGLVERPGRMPTESTVELLGVVDEVGRGGHDPQSRVVDRLCAITVERLTQGTGYADDVTVLAARRIPPVPPLELTLAALPDAVRVARVELADWLHGLTVTSLDEVALQHAVGELVTNAVDHAYAGGGREHEVRVSARLRDDGVLEASVEDDGRWQGPEETDGRRGRGLAMARAFVDELDVLRGDTGTRAVVRVRLLQPVDMLVGTASAGHVVLGRSTEVHERDGALRVVGDVDRDGAIDLEMAIARVSRGGSRPLVVDLAGVGLLCSAAVRVLVDARAHGELRLRAPAGSPAQHVLDLVQLPYEN